MKILILFAHPRLKTSVVQAAMLKAIGGIEGVTIRDLYALYQLTGSDRVERRLRILTIISAVTLPLALITGILGMNVGGMPGIDYPYGFLMAVILMMAIAASMVAAGSSHGRRPCKPHANCLKPKEMQQLPPAPRPFASGERHRAGRCRAGR